MQFVIKLHYHLFIKKKIDCISILNFFSLVTMSNSKEVFPSFWQLRE